ncbi:hypothetical protein E3N88_16935 [Mikania micrantha]|uniref:Ycf20-like protein n=1 Tax=Mikania micrantha TaxID=192012 RepID=A0A5N6NRN0_9ASTR|nr:hypothetical protein E3N88_16935 [Mikania micrantha]
MLVGRKTWHIRSSADGSGLNPSSTNNNNNGTRLIRAIQAFQIKLSARIKNLRKDLPMKLLFFLTGFYCSTAFATVIGQTGDWDILSAALAVAVVEGIGALMYTGSFPLFNKVRNLITMFNYWKGGLTMGLFLDSFKNLVDYSCSKNYYNALKCSIGQKIKRACHGMYAGLWVGPSVQLISTYTRKLPILVHFDVLIRSSYHR